MKKIKITLVKSPIDRPERQKLTVQALGLNKTNSTKEVEATPQILGMLRKVTHLVKVEEIGMCKYENVMNVKIGGLSFTHFHTSTFSHY